MWLVVFCGVRIAWGLQVTRALRVLRVLRTLEGTPEYSRLAARVRAALRAAPPERDPADRRRDDRPKYSRTQRAPQYSRAPSALEYSHALQYFTGLHALVRASAGFSPLAVLPPVPRGPRMGRIARTPQRFRPPPRTSTHVPADRSPVPAFPPASPHLARPKAIGVSGWSLPCQALWSWGRFSSCDGVFLCVCVCIHVFVSVCLLLCFCRPPVPRDGVHEPRRPLQRTAAGRSMASRNGRVGGIRMCVVP
jgi:hypothetical protein